MPNAPQIRVEHDLIGSREVLAGSRSGIHTLRALENFPAHEQRVCDVRAFARAFGQVKLAALRANAELGTMPPSVVGPLDRACRELIADEHGLRSALVLPIVQGGAGTSTNMNVNEVLANRALEIMGRPPGDYRHCHPNDHVNRSQSTNDTYPTALRLALLERHADLMVEATTLLDALRERAAEHRKTPKLGRTQLQDAVPMTVGDEVDAWADAWAAALDQARAACDLLYAVNLGGTAIGTGIAAPQGFAERVQAHLKDITGLPLRLPRRLVSATTDPTALLAVSGSLRTAAIVLGKLADDLRLLASGPNAGLGEYKLPAVQAGSSLMPGKVNPVIPEYVNQLAFDVRGRDSTVALALASAELQLNAMLPVVAQALFASQDALRVAARVLRAACIDGLEVHADLMAMHVAGGLGEATERAAQLGHDELDAELGVRA